MFWGKSRTLGGSSPEREVHQQEMKRNGCQIRGTASARAPAAMRLHSAQPAEPRRGLHNVGMCRLRSFESEESRKVVWDTEQADRGWRCFGSTGITSQPLLPGQARVSPLGTREDDLPFFGMHLGSRRKLHGHPLVSQELEAGPPMLPAVPVTPEQRMGADLEGMQ